LKNTSRWLGGGDFPTALVFVFPLLLAYEVGVLFSDAVNGVDFVTRGLIALAGGSRSTYLMIHLGLVVAYLVAILLLRHHRRLDLGAFLPMILESSIYALTLGSLIVFVMESLIGLSRSLSIAAAIDLGRVGQLVVISLGAGVHEELVFRLLLFGGLAWLMQTVGAKRGVAVTVAMLASALLFSLAHHLGPHGEDLDAAVFAYRALAGAVFALIFYYRSFAHAVYTHFLYDLYVLVLRS